MTMLIAEKGWTKNQLHDCIDEFTIEDLQAFIPKLLTKGLFIESIVYGNITEKVRKSIFIYIQVFFYHYRILKPFCT